MAQSATVLWSVLLTSSTIFSSLRVIENLDFSISNLLKLIIVQTLLQLYPKLTGVINTLPPDALDERSRFLDYLQYKYEQQTQNTNVATLGGLWTDVDLDIDDAEIS
jgi:hypothetical protein